MALHSRALALLLSAALAAAVFGIAGCTTEEGVIAKVNGQPVKAADVQMQLDQMKKASPQTFSGTEGPKREQEFRAKILESLIQVELIRQAGKDLGVAVTTKQVDDYIKGLEAQYGGATGLADAMKQSGVTTEQLRASVTNRLLVDAVGKKVATPGAVTEADMKAYYEKNIGTFKTGAQVNAEHILFATADKPTAESVFDQVKKGGDFAALAKQYSTDPGTKDKGGSLGWAPATQYVAEFAKAVQEMKVNEVRLVSTQFGWHVIKLLGTKPAAQQTFEQVKAQITQVLQQQGQSDALTKYVQELKKKAKIEILDPEIKKLIDAASAPATSTAPPN